MKKAISYSETSVLTRSMGRNIPEDTVLHSHRRENLKSYLNKEKLCEVAIVVLLRVLKDCIWKLSVQLVDVFVTCVCVDFVFDCNP
jgi:hypothetical protein